MEQSDFLTLEEYQILYLRLSVTTAMNTEVKDKESIGGLVSQKMLNITLNQARKIIAETKADLEISHKIYELAKYTSN